MPAATNLSTMNPHSKGGGVGPVIEPLTPTTKWLTAETLRAMEASPWTAICHLRIPPSAWPSITRLLGPEAEVETSELYAVVDVALDALPQDLGDALYLVDIEGHSLQTAGGLLNREPAQLQRELARARLHVREYVNGYLAGR